MSSGMTSDVFCMMAYARIPASVCSQEQGGTSCRGCSAATRRCTKCGQLRGIVNARKGLCADCDKAQPAQNDGIAGALERMRSTIQDIGDTELPPVEKNELSSPPGPAANQLITNIASVQTHDKSNPAHLIITVVAEHFRFNVADLLHDSRDIAPIAEARQIAMYLMRRFLRYSYPTIGQIFQRDHSTVMHGCDKIMRQYNNNSGMHLQIKALEAKLSEAGLSMGGLSEHVTQQSVKQGSAKQNCRSKCTEQMAGDQIQSLQQCTYVCNIVAGYFQVTVDSLRIRTNTLATNQARALAIYLLIGVYKMPLHMIRTFFGGIQQDQVNRIYQKLQGRLALDPQLQEVMATLKQQLGQVTADEATVEPEAPATETLPSPAPPSPAPIAAPPVTLPPAPKLRSRSAVPRCSKTFSEIYQLLLGRSVKIGDARLVRGAVPLLQMEAKIGPADALRALQRLVDDKHIVRKDDRWTIVLMKESIDNNELICPATSETTPLVIINGGTVQSQRRMVVPRPPRTMPVAPPSLTGANQSPLNAIDAAINQLNQLLPSLRQSRNEVNQQVAVLEANLIALTLLRDKSRTVENNIQQLLQDTQTAMTAILATLHKI